MTSSPSDPGARPDPDPDPDAADIGAALVRMGLVGPDERPELVPLTGGVSSDIRLVHTRRGPVCVKRALARLRTAARWEAPVERTRSERAWLEVAATVVPGAVPAVLGHDDRAGLFAMTWLEPATHPVWKTLLLAGQVDAGVAAAVGDRVGRVHAATADDPAVAARFANDALFDALRLGPYLDATAAVHPVVAPVLARLRARTAATRRVLIHGDVSPKNVLVGPAGPVLLDAECATFGDPAFDPAFCATHLLLKAVVRPAQARACASALVALGHAYLAHVAWEPPADVHARAATLVPALLLARVDGTSPVEYLDDHQRDRVRRAALGLLGDVGAGTAPATLDALAERWLHGLAG